MLTRFPIAIALLWTPEFLSLTFFAGVFVIFSWNFYCLYCIFVILGRVSDAVGRGYVIRTTVDVGVFDADVFGDGGSGNGGAGAGRWHGL